jgi:hypothetical protein
MDIAEDIAQGFIENAYNPMKHKAMNECAICLENFTEDSFVTALPCNESHYFHTNCISDWITKG